MSCVFGKINLNKTEGRISLSQVCGMIACGVFILDFEDMEFYSGEVMEFYSDQTMEFY